MPPREIWNPRQSQTHFQVYFYFALLFLEVNQFEHIWRKKKLNICSNRFTIYRQKKRNVISKFDHRKLALWKSSTNIGKNLYRSISLILTLEQNIPVTITSWQPLVFILSPSFLSISADALHIFSLHFETFTTHRFNWALLHLLPECLFFYFCFL